MNFIIFNYTNVLIIYIWRRIVMILDAMTYSIIAVVAVMAIVVIRLSRARAAESAQKDSK